MAELDDLAPNYRRAQRRWPDAPTLQKHYSALAASFGGGGYALVEHVKSFIESVCLTILTELHEPRPSPRPSTTDLLVAALKPLGLRNTRGAHKLDKVLSGFNRLSDALGEMRDEAGPVAHGKDGFLDSVNAEHARAFLSVGDAILGVLLNALEGKEPDLRFTREPYDTFQHLHARIDRAVSIVARVEEDAEPPVVVCSLTMGAREEPIDLRLEASRLLYGIDREAYIEVLRTVGEAEARGGEPEAETGPAKPPELSWAPALGGPRVALVVQYSGSLHRFRQGLEDVLGAEMAQPAQADGSGNRLLDSLLETIEQNAGLDWTEREAIQARLKLACKRVFVHFGLEPEKAANVAGRLVAWLRGRMGGSGREDAALTITEGKAKA